MGTMGSGSLRQVIEPVVSKLAVHILNNGFTNLVEMIVDNCQDQLYMLPALLLKYAFNYQKSITFGSQPTEVCIMP